MAPTMLQVCETPLCVCMCVCVYVCACQIIADIVTGWYPASPNFQRMQFRSHTHTHTHTHTRTLKGATSVMNSWWTWSTTSHQTTRDSTAVDTTSSYWCLAALAAMRSDLISLVHFSKETAQIKWLFTYP